MLKVRFETTPNVQPAVLFHFCLFFPYFFSFFCQSIDVLEKGHLSLYFFNFFAFFWHEKLSIRQNPNTSRVQGQKPKISNYHKAKKYNNKTLGMQLSATN